MKKALLVLSALFVFFAASAQDEDSTEAPMSKKEMKSFYRTPYKLRNSGSFDNHTMILSLSYGFPNYLYGASYYGSSYYGENGIGLGPIMLRYQVAVHDEVGVEIFGQYAAKKWTDGSYTEKATGAGVGVLGVYHFNKWIPVRKLDVYAAVGFEVNQDHISDNQYEYSDTRMQYNPIGLLGARYYFAKNFGGFVELGYTAYSYANIGLSFSFGKKMHRVRSSGRDEQKVNPGS